MTLRPEAANECGAHMKRNVLIPIGGILIIVCFFLPWTKACGVKFSGFQLASDKVIGDPVFWVILLSGLGILAGFFLARGSRPVVLVSTTLGALVLIIKLIIPLLRGEGRELDLSLDAGGYGTILGFILSFLGGLSQKEEHDIPRREPAPGFGRPDIRKDMERLDRETRPPRLPGSNR